jgi:hypothetical protein
VKRGERGGRPTEKKGRRGIFLVLLEKKGSPRRKGVTMEGEKGAKCEPEGGLRTYQGCRKKGPRERKKGCPMGKKKDH